jgi:hypothetical protein
VVKHRPSKCKALISNLSSEKEKKGKKCGKGESQEELCSLARWILS